MPVSYVRRVSCAAAMILALGQTAEAGGLAGAYLAGRAATYDSDFTASAMYYARALVRDPQNTALMDNLIYAQLALGNLKAAAPVASRMWEAGQASQVANLAMAGNFALLEDYDGLLARDVDRFAISPLVDGLLNAWAYMGQGSVSQALEAFDTVASQEALRFFANYHKALALASVGDYEGAEALFAANGGQLGRSSRRAAIARVQILSQLGQNDKAREVLVASFGSGFDPALSALSDRLAAGETLDYTVAIDAKAGMAEVFFSVASALSGEAANDYVLMYARMATVLNPEHVDAILLTAGLLDQLGRYDLSIETYKLVPRDHPDFHAAELGRAEALRRAAKPMAAVEVLQQLARDFPDHIAVQVELGDLMRQQEDYAAAAAAYDRALALSDEGASNRWFLFYARGICHERMKDWEAAEADFRAALAIDPDQPQVLNYLGYSLVERQENLEEALDMIERAVEARPDSGYIVDSLGWVLYRLGRYEEAVAHMERAVELMPVDAVVNDHLGDVYWAVGRHLEAQFQWRRALSFTDPEETDSEADPERMRRKLEVGLDVVLDEEGAAPLKLANDEG